ncbi:hypothetical protein KPL76_12085 [Subtercola sp. PAMC28395]|uniref:hypothetical protein n=1 Tax=Subtercola sp. PAMC28395 TaxID=2846775 RepID=UPI001C0BC8CD|nr:hypothetical protein [Subtercola sp. PAMC28395]QWT23450.1 hypothetical protein KPL76_12085 [Subtercola sp. PAMC28395]
MLAAVLLLLVGTADLARSGRRFEVARVAIPLVWLVIVLLAVTGLGTPWWALVAPLVIAGAWLLTTTTLEHVKPPSGLWPVAGLGVALLLLLAIDTTGQSASGFLVQWHADAPVDALRQASLTTVVLGFSAAVFLTESGNVVVRASLHRTPPAVSLGPVNRAPSAAGPDDIDLSAADLRGGRLIGPLERLLIVTLALAGMYPIVAALIAAKGIVRFPEISRDGPSGSKAEYFLVGSLVSWSIAVAIGGLLWISAHG